MFTKKNDDTPRSDPLTPQQALRYWKDAARTLRTMLAQLDRTTPETGEFEGMLDDLRDAATSHLIAANALVGHYTMLVGDRAERPAPPAPQPALQPQRPAAGWNPPAQGPPPQVPPARQAAMPSYQVRDQHSVPGGR